ncbi:MAG: GAF domain-containing protein [Nitrospirae bacterium]|nr:GAF domain-containing protein [Nitrospirota bacterium]
MDNQLKMVCGWCKKIRADDTSWQTIEEYFAAKGLGETTHGMCPGCSEKIFEKRVYLESYQNICKVISSSISLEETLNLIVTSIVKVMNVKASLLRLINKKSGTLDVAAYYGLSKEYVNKGSVVIDKSIEDALSGKQVSVYDITFDEDSKYHKEAKKEGISSILSIPLRFKDEIIGVLRMYTAEPRDYVEEDRKFLMAIAEQAAIVIMNAKEYETMVTREKEYLRLFREISKAVSSSLKLEEVLNSIVFKIAEAFRVKAVTIKLIDEITKKFTVVASCGLKERFFANTPLKDMNISQALRYLYLENPALPFPHEKDIRILQELNLSPVAIYDATTDSRVLNKKDIIEEGIKSILTVPIQVRDKLIGVLTIYTGWYKNFTQEETDFSSFLAEQCGIAIENARMYEKKYKEVTYLKTIQEITKLMSKHKDPNEIMDLIVKKLPEVMNTKAATIRLIDPETNKLKLMASSGLSTQYLGRGDVEGEENIKAALKGEPVAIYDVGKDPRVVYHKEAEEEGIKSLLAVPLMSYNNNTIGVLRLLTTQHRDFTKDEIDFAMALCEEVSIALENALLLKQLSQSK